MASLGLIEGLRTVISVQVSSAARRPVLATADSPGLGTATDLNPLRTSVGVTQSMTSEWRATKLLKLKPYNLTVVHELLPRDHAEWLNFCNWILQKFMIE